MRGPSLALLLGLLAAPAVRAQGVFFDDFDYPEASTADDLARPGSLYGPNAWLEGAPGGPLRLSPPQRAWYAFLWSENRGWYAYDHNGADRSWFDPPGAYLTTTERPGHVVLRLDAGTYREQQASGGTGWAWFTSGLTTRTGTWAVRVRLPSFEGLRHVQPGGDEMTVVAAPIWTQSSYTFVDTMRAHTWNSTNRVWSEASLEVANWLSPAQPNPPHRAIAFGVSWAGPFSALRRSPVPGLPNAAGTVQHDACRVGTRVRRRADCFRALTESGAFYTVVVSIDSFWTRLALLDDAGRLFMQSETLAHDVPPQPMRAVVDLAYFIGTDPARVETVTMRRRRDMVVDWLMVLPGQTPAPARVPALVADARAVLRRAGASRLNTTGRPVEAPVRRAFAPCFGLPYAIPTLPFDVRVRRYDRADATFLNLHLTDGAADGAPGTATRQQDVALAWDVERLDGQGQVVERRRYDAQGQTLRLPRRSGGAWRATVVAEALARYEPTLETRTCSDTGPARIVRTFLLPDP